VTSFWHTTVDAEPQPDLRGEVSADVLIVGGGYTGLWTALELLRRDPALDVVLCEAETAGFGASGRNGGFAESSLTHGLANGIRHFGSEISELERLAEENWQGFVDTARGLDCDFEANGLLDVAVAPWQAGELADSAELHRSYGQPAELLDTQSVQERVRSPMFVAGLYHPHGSGLVNPAKLALGLRGLALRAGARCFEHSRVVRLEAGPRGVLAETPGGRVRAERAVIAANAYSGELLRQVRRHFVPVYDHVLVSDPLTPDQRAAVGWRGREGVADAGNQFHYLRLTADDRVLWGGYDAVYHYGNGVGPRYDHRPATYRRLETHFRQAFPQLAELQFTHRWGGAIATTTRFTPVFGTALGGRAVYALGYTGLGVVATRFAARVLADKLLAPDSPLLSLRYVTSAPFPFPPEPLRWAAVTAVRRAIADADRRGGRRGPLLRALDRFGIGFDS
jgi:glycine/D-amino acid oxidase-like deaminating enzyme